MRSKSELKREIKRTCSEIRWAVRWDDVITCPRARCKSYPAGGGIEPQEDPHNSPQPRPFLYVTHPPPSRRAGRWHGIARAACRDRSAGWRCCVCVCVRVGGRRGAGCAHGSRSPPSHHHTAGHAIGRQPGARRQEEARKEKERVHRQTATRVLR